ncbi:hypothetical protein VNO77_27212 [Canavalia gladiata]|uniref:Uncharacterized protein n=1 Tax=Canavalia gladiata TaxID=3824 RepID=A0AAN9KWJ1_CANGL
MGQDGRSDSKPPSDNSASIVLGDFDCIDNLADEESEFECEPTDEMLRLVERESKIIEPHQEPIDLINLGTEENKREVKIGTLIAGDNRERLISLLQDYSDIFAWSYQDMPGLDTSIVEHKLPMKVGCTPVKQKLRRMKPEMSLKIREEVRKQFDAGFLAVANYPEWVANIVPVPKKDGKVRMCVDYRDLNRASPKDDFPLPHIDVPKSVKGSALAEYLAQQPIDDYQVMQPEFPDEDLMAIFNEEEKIEEEKWTMLFDGASNMMGHDDYHTFQFSKEFFFLLNNYRTVALHTTRRRELKLESISERIAQEKEETPSKRGRRERSRWGEKSGDLNRHLATISAWSLTQDQYSSMIDKLVACRCLNSTKWFGSCSMNTRNLLDPVDNHSTNPDRCFQVDSRKEFHTQIYLRLLVYLFKRALALDPAVEACNAEIDATIRGSVASQSALDSCLLFIAFCLKSYKTIKLNKEKSIFELKTKPINMI